MGKFNYEQKVLELVEIIDIAIDCFISHSPIDFKEQDVKQFVTVYSDYRKKALNPDPKFRNASALKQDMIEVLTYFNESSGNAVKAFWKEVDTRQLNVKRVNVFEKILKRGKIKNHLEYDVIIDLYNSYVETNMLSDYDIEKINNLIIKFENRDRII